VFVVIKVLPDGRKICHFLCDNSGPAPGVRNSKLPVTISLMCLCNVIKFAAVINTMGGAAYLPC
jgi:hypothetical protein